VWRAGRCIAAIVADGYKAACSAMHLGEFQKTNTISNLKPLGRHT
jgi:hypothetical protein